MSRRIFAFSLVAVLALSGHTLAGSFVAPDAVSADQPNGFGVPTFMIADATGNGGFNYVAPNPSSGGGGTSWWTNTLGTTPVTISFDFNAAQDLEELYLWDYYTHTPTLWTLQLFSGAGGGGSQLLDFDFDIAPTGPVSVSLKHVLDFSDVAGVLSGALTSRNNSTRGGTGIAEFGFNGSASAAAVPLPSAAWAGLGLLGVIGAVRRYRRRNAA